MPGAGSISTTPGRAGVEDVGDHLGREQGGVRDQDGRAPGVRRDVGRRAHVGDPTPWSPRTLATAREPEGSTAAGSR